ncbi:MAG: glycoside hydrolase family 16 protein [Anaerolineales bacterium]|nr:glycoside hydrolase family 16 protein [Anaerolineales bacterium]
MKIVTQRLSLPFLGLAILLTGCALTSGLDAPAGWTLVWADEFNQPDGSAPDPSRWNHATGGSGWGNAELQHYSNSTDNAYIQDGMLVIQANEETSMGRNYTSARLHTMVWAEWTYGRFEIRARLPNTPGIWPAFWLLPASATRYGTWPAGGEIDIMEMIGSQPGRVYATIHYNNPHRQSGGHYDLPAGQTFADDFHVFALEWEPEEMRWYVDGVLYHTETSWFTNNAPFPAPFDQPFYLLINLAVGGTWPGSPDETSAFPQYLFVDYVRVYQKEP